MFPPDTDHMKKRAGEKCSAMAAVDYVISTIERRHREPDLWEKVHVARALNCIFRGMYPSAIVEAQLGLTPEHKRSPHANLPNDLFFAKCDTRLLRKVLADISGEPVRAFPHFGPVIFN